LYVGILVFLFCLAHCFCAWGAINQTVWILDLQFLCEFEKFLCGHLPASGEECR